MPPIVRGGLNQATLCEPVTSPLEKIKRAMIDKHVALVEHANPLGLTFSVRGPGRPRNAQ